MIRANATDFEFENIIVKRGQLVTSRTHLSNELGLTEHQIRTALNHLKMTGEIEVRTTSKFSIITIKNYNLYQSKYFFTANKSPASDRQTAGKPPQYKNDKNNKNEKKREPLPQNGVGYFKNVYLTQAQLNALEKLHPDTFKQKIENLSNYLERSGKSYNSHYAVLLNWLAEDKEKDSAKHNTKASYDIEDYENYSMFD
ncbi:MAG: hypothetical protein IJV39_06430 [Ruminococcus sp.]|nr:hypothetical protein [Ruminococcus sp.]